MPGIMVHTHLPQPTLADSNTAHGLRRTEVCQWTLLRPHQMQQGHRLSVRAGNINHILDLSDILYISYRDHYTTFMLMGLNVPTELRQISLRQNLCRFEMLKEVGIVRTARDQMVNLCHIERVEGGDTIFLKWLPKMPFHVGNSYLNLVKGCMKDIVGLHCHGSP